MARILMLEDDAYLAESMVCVLTHAGHEVLHVDCIAAIDDVFLDPKQTAFDFLIADDGLPDGSGMEVAIQAAHGFPDMRVIAWSGGWSGRAADTIASAHPQLHAVLQKGVGAVDRIRELTRAS